jgi:hypothetical protein
MQAASALSNCLRDGGAAIKAPGRIHELEVARRARAMRYFFDIRDDQLVPDEEGMILPDIEAAQEEATRTLTDLVREAMRAGSAGGMTIEVRSQHGPVLEASLTWRLIVKS